MNTGRFPDLAAEQLAKRRSFRRLLDRELVNNPKLREAIAVERQLSMRNIATVIRRSEVQKSYTRGRAIVWAAACTSLGWMAFPAAAAFLPEGAAIGLGVIPFVFAVASDALGAFPRPSNEE